MAGSRWEHDKSVGEAVSMSAAMFAWLWTGLFLYFALHAALH